MEIRKHYTMELSEKRVLGEKRGGESNENPIVVAIIAEEYFDTFLQYYRITGYGKRNNCSNNNKPKKYQAD